MIAQSRAMLVFSCCTWTCSPLRHAWSLQRAFRMSPCDQQTRDQQPFVSAHEAGNPLQGYRASRHQLTAAAGQTQSAPGGAGDAQLEEWLQLEEDEPWDDADTDEDDAEQHADATASTTSPSAAAESPEAADEDGSSSSDGSGPSWSESLPYKLRRGERGWNGQVPPDVVVIAPPQRDAEGNAQGSLLGSSAGDQPDPAAAQQQPSPTSRSQWGAPPKPRGATGGRPQGKTQKGSQKGRRKGGGNAGGGSRPAGPDWLRNLPPAN